MLPPHRLLFSISSKICFICTIPQPGKYIPQPLLYQLFTSLNKKLLNGSTMRGRTMNGRSTTEEGRIFLFNDAFNTFYLRLYG